MKNSTFELVFSVIQRLGLLGCFVFALGLGTYYVAQTSPEVQLQAAATDREGRLILATGYVAPDLEAVYSLDQTTGRLSAGILSRKGGKFQGMYQGDVNNDLAALLQTKGALAAFPATPKYSLVTGEVDAENRGGARWKVAKSVVYIAEANTGMVLVYTIPWEQTLHGADQNHSGNLELLAAEQFHPAYTGEVSGL